MNRRSLTRNQALALCTLSDCLFFSISEFLIYCQDCRNRKRPFQSINLGVQIPASSIFITLSQVDPFHWDPTYFTFNNLISTPPSPTMYRHFNWNSPTTKDNEPQPTLHGGQGVTQFAQHILRLPERK